MKNNNIQSEIENLIATNREGEYWDFKVKHHENKADLLHDIMCLANNRADNDGYIIFGVDDNYIVEGVGEDKSRKNQQNLIDFLKSKEFSGHVRPTIELKTIIVKEKEVDILIIKNSTDTPFFLTKNYQDKGRKVRANYIYTRVGDTNTDIDKSADINHIEHLWRKRFLLNRPPLEQIKQKLCFKNEWKSDEHTYYNVFNPEYTVNLERDDDRGRAEFYSYVMTNSSTSFGSLELRYFGTKLYEHQYAVLDSGRYITAVPEWGFITYGKYQNETNMYKYFIKGSLEYNLHEFLLEDNHEAIWAKDRLYEVVVIFNSKLEKTNFEEYLHKNKEIFVKEIDRINDSYSWIDTGNELEKQQVKERIRSGKAIKNLLEKYREERRNAF